VVDSGREGDFSKRRLMESDGVKLWGEQEWGKIEFV
jgi:hypothetical protein